MRVLQIIKCDLEKNGIVTFVNCALELIKKDEVEMDVFVPGKVRNQEIKHWIENNGARVIEGNVRKDAFFRLNAGVKLYSFLKKNTYDVVHINTGDSALLATMNVASKLAGKSKVVVHSHGCIKPKGLIKKSVFLLSKKIVGKSADVFMACSEEAGQSAFPKNIKKVIVLQNGVDPEKYKYNVAIEKSMREQCNAKNCMIIGHVGSFTKVKNHEFLIDVFEVIANKVSNAKLLLIGDGEERETIERRVKDKKLQNNVVFTGNVDDVPRFLQMMDVFVFPSIKEGTPFACLEAQAAGVPCVLSTGISEETIINPDNVVRLDLSVDKMVWVDTIIKCANYGKKQVISLNGSKYDVNTAMLDLKNVYKDCIKRGNK